MTRGILLKAKKNKKKKKPSNIYKYCLIFIGLILLSGFLYFYYYKTKNSKSIYDETKLKNLKLKSRIFFGPIFDDSFKDGKISEKGIKKYETMAKNNVALIVTEGMMIGDSSLFPPTGKEILRIDNDGYIEEYKKLSDAVHKYNTYIFMQLNHPGLMSTSDIIYSPSPDKGFFKNITSK